VVSICITCVDDAANKDATINSLSTGSFSYTATSFTDGIFWQAIGY